LILILHREHFDFQLQHALFAQAFGKCIDSYALQFNERYYSPLRLSQLKNFLAPPYGRSPRKLPSPANAEQVQLSTSRLHNNRYFEEKDFFALLCHLA